MEIANIRIDDRLIHGQVVVMWSKRLSVNRIVVVDDEVVKNPTQKSVLKMACPNECKLSILSVPTAVSNLMARKYEGDRILLIVGAPKTLRAMHDAGYSFTAVNVGNMSKKPDAQKLGHSVYVTPQDMEDFRYLKNKGVALVMQRVPTEAAESLSDKI